MAGPRVSREEGGGGVRMRRLALAQAGGGTLMQRSGASKVGSSCCGACEGWAGGSEEDWLETESQWAWVHGSGRPESLGFPVVCLIKCAPEFTSLSQQGPRPR